MCIMKVRTQLRQYISLYTEKLHESEHQKRRKFKKQLKVYFRFGNFRENFIFANSIKKHIKKNSRLRQDLPISINDRVMLPFREGFIFTKLCICEVSQN